MSRRTSSILLSFIAAFALSVNAAKPSSKPSKGETLETVLKKVIDQQKKTMSLEAEFRQEKTLALLAQPEISTGTFSFAKPNQVLWVYQAPRKLQLLVSKGWLTTYYPDLNKAERLEVKRFEDRIFKYMGATGTIEELARYFDFTFTDTKGQPSYRLELSPKTKIVAKRVRKITIWIDRSSYLTNRFEYVEGDGDITKYDFTNIRLNQKIEPTRFTLNLPATVKMQSMKLN
ncbi:MAG TPA: outer membrane lipoprotein carrier protein LolA [Thermoanaerobaculia bacterium]|nr:outer membrane lipoprotein carrier protein LolA [Thermoanaerobaculia bacterium]